MSWRRFASLLRGLPADSGWMRLLAAEAQKPRLVTDQDEACRIFDRIG